ncbi:MAG: transcriptional regulator [Salibacteraceae bacterium]
MMFKPLDPLLHSPLRLAVMSLLVAVDRADFNYLKKHTESTSGNLSVQIKKLETAGYITVKKGYKNNRPHTECAITSKGKAAFQAYVNNLNEYLNPKS